MQRFRPAAACLSVLLGAFATLEAAAEQGSQPITLKVSAPEGNGTFACHMEVSVSHPESLKLKEMTVIAKAYNGNMEIASTGLDTDGRPLVRDRDPATIDYESVPLQFGLAEEDCEMITGLGVVFASCTFAGGRTENCLERLRISPQAAGQVAFFVGEPMPPAQ